VIDALREAMMVPSILFAIDLGILLAWVIVLQTLAAIVLYRKTQF
jgi:hypothetical protein